MSGLGRVMPFTFGAFALASLSMIGAPPVAGFVSKWYLLNGAFDAGSVGIIIVLLVSTLLNAAYFAPVVYNGFFGKASAADAEHKYTRSAPGAGDSAGHHRRHLGRHRPLPRLLHELRPRCPVMKLVKLIEFLRDRLKTVMWVCCAVLALLVVLDAIPGRGQGTTPTPGRSTARPSGPCSASSAASLIILVLQMVWPPGHHDPRGLLRG